MRNFLLISVVFTLVWGCASTLPETKEVVVEVPVQQPSLLELAKEGNQNKIEELVNKFSDLNQTDSLGNTPLHYGITTSNLPLVEFLVFKGANANIPNHKGLSPLAVAVKGEDRDILKALATSNRLEFYSLVNEHSSILEEIIAKDLITLFWDHPDLQTPDGEGNNLYHYLAKQNKLGVLQDLPIHNPAFNIKNKEGLRPVDIVLKMGDRTSVEGALLLFKAGGSPPLDKNYLYLHKYAALDSPNVRFEDGQTALHYGATYSHLGVLDYLISTGANIDRKDTPGATPLHRAVQKDSLAGVDSLLKAGANINAKDFNHYTPLHYALAYKVSSAVIDLIISNGADVNIKDIYGNTPLHLAVMNSDVPTILRLISHGADVNIRNKNGNTPLYEGVIANKQKESQVLLQTGANIFAVNYKGSSPLVEALQLGQDTIEWFLQEKQTNKIDDSGNIPLHYAIRYSDSPDLIKSLIEKTHLINQQNRDGNSPLHLAVMLEKWSVIEPLILKQADLYSINNQGNNAINLLFRYDLDKFKTYFGSAFLNNKDGLDNTPLFYAVEENNFAAVEKLLNLGADIYHKNSNGKTLLHISVKKGNPEMTKLLLKNGADPDSVDDMGNTPLHDAIIWKKLNTASVLMEEKAQIDIRNIEGNSPLLLAINTGNTEFIEFLLTRGANTEIRNLQGKTALFLAVERSDMPLVSRLLKSGADYNTRDNQGNTLLHHAIKKGSPEVISIVAALEDNWFALNSFNQTPISLAFYEGLERTKALIHKEQLTLRNEEGESLLHLAVKEKAPEDIFVYLFLLGMDPNPRNKDGKTPLDLALEDKNSGIAEILMSNGAS